MNHNLIFLTLTVTLGILSFFLTRVVTKLALKYDIVDHPRTERFHTVSTPLLGGVAINLSFLTGSLFYFPLHGSVLLLASILGLIAVLKQKRNAFLLIASLSMAVYTALVIFFPLNGSHNWLYLLGGSQIVFFTGLFDDAIKEMGAGIKMPLQLAAALYFVLPGQVVTFFPFPLNYIVTVFWIVSLINAFNLIDGMNGLAAGVAFLSSVFFGLISHYTGQVTLSYICFIFAGAILGYIPDNFPKARLFMGDTGSMYLGFTLGAIAIFGTWKTNAPAISLAVPLMVLMYPLFDVGLVMFNRIIERRPIWVGGNDHSHHRFVNMGLSPFDAVLFIYLIAFYNGFSAYFITMVSYRSGVKMLVFTIAIMALLGIRLTFVKVKAKTPVPSINKGDPSITD
ncbi:undecaprenyl/decaprenyl-phosphate alpha-N-acetylglucosaminyl 1-phosphate transferase [Myxococcota bacterium]|nr:undecaprenyl/decaprenyl-phosphate alpha-N-acetylglucosaminyl 1-phosphate transferase [Myxococcota bacterium]MBU1381705.1 undecaprenyl/decaprenyl-phosphate alpha-N-acetylglucosaminyl 1-phosphate transferase [Myxococcota bacterium]MBU1497487.1 undecaprenyl/decaprenyl-phosphate alpha-N-acetylglucosaminyl 1-phosphate transferase [Myxococcota bacterium]